MKIRHILSGLLVVLLLCGSSWATACELSCALHRAMPMCHEVSGQRSVQAADHASGMVMAAGECAGMAEPSGVRVDAVASAAGCGHRFLLAECVGESSPDEVNQASVRSMCAVIGVPVVSLEAAAFMGASRGDPDGSRLVVFSLRV